jgi:hypothetical protein
MEEKVKNGFHWLDTTSWSLSFKRVSNNYVKSILVMFDKPIHRLEVKRKLKEVFGR